MPLSARIVSQPIFTSTPPAPVNRVTPQLTPAPPVQTRPNALIACPPRIIYNTGAVQLATPLSHIAHCVHLINSALLVNRTLIICNRETAHIAIPL